MDLNATLSGVVIKESYRLKTLICVTEYVPYQHLSAATCPYDQNTLPCTQIKLTVLEPTVHKPGAA
ncbi:hypothetical protein TspCOW1_04850 [Thiohalobacter sp. COW1]|nr:hypothetical protein TspCOW1_04850 [Thiohalobacter sp. COW1]